MLKNQISLARLLGIMFLAVAFFIGIVGFVIFTDSNSDSSLNFWLPIIFFFLVVVFVFSGVGLILKNDFARHFTVGILYGCIALWTILAFLWLTSGSLFNDRQMLTAVSIVIGIYLIFYGSILVLNHHIVREEFEKKEF